MEKVILILKTTKTICRIISENHIFTAEINGERKESGTLDEAWFEIKEHIDNCLDWNHRCNRRVGFIDIPPELYDALAANLGEAETNKFLYEMTTEITERIADKCKKSE